MRATEPRVRRARRGASLPPRGDDAAETQPPRPQPRGELAAPVIDPGDGGDNSRRLINGEFTDVVDKPFMPLMPVSAGLEERSR